MLKARILSHSLNPDGRINAERNRNGLESAAGFRVPPFPRLYVIDIGPDASACFRRRGADADALSSRVGGLIPACNPGSRRRSRGKSHQHAPSFYLPHNNSTITLNKSIVAGFFLELHGV